MLFTRSKFQAMPGRFQAPDRYAADVVGCADGGSTPQVATAGDGTGRRASKPSGRKRQDGRLPADVAALAAFLSFRYTGEIAIVRSFLRGWRRCWRLPLPGLKQTATGRHGA
jgi:hypothetical protein